MCGITGWVDFENDLSGQQAILIQMVRTLKKRGPDQENIWCQQHVAFGHQRLAVIDLAGGKQPMTRERDGYYYTITYNGELYNTEEIRRELLQRGHNFITYSDTEVLLKAFIEWKEQCVHHLNGIFCFAVWDGLQEKLTIVRDRLGVKPLFYKEHRGQLLFGSEIKAILAHPDVKPAISREGLAEVLGLGPSRTPGKGVFQGVQELRPGHMLQFSREGLHISRYWQVESKPHLASFQETVEYVQELVTDAVERQLVSDVPLCTFLSGGLDSSIITAIAANKYKKQEKQLHTFSIDFENNEQFFKANDFQTTTDQYWIRQMSEQFQTAHSTKIISQQQLIEHLTEAVHVRDLPGMADVDASLLWFCREMKQEFTVALSGECADEIFGGYPWFKKLQSGFPWIRSLDERNRILRPEWQKKLALHDYVQTAYEETLKEVPRLDGEGEEASKRRELFYLNMTWFMATLLERKDRMSMGASLEVRVPFADHRIIEYAWNIPWEMKNVGQQEKGILRKAMEGLLPQEVVYRKKNPYPKTYHPAYTTGVQKWLQNIVLKKNSILHEFFDKEQLEELITSGGQSFQVPWFGQLMAGPQLLAYLIQLHIWFEDYQIQLQE